MIRIDAHQHYWDPSRGDYGWMPKNDPVISKVYAHDDLNPHLEKHGINRTIVVQAAPTLAETEYLLDLADKTDSIAGVVGWVNFEDPGQIADLQRFSESPKFKGVRPMIQNISDVDWMLREEFQWVYRAICDLDLTFDALGYPKHLDNFRKLALQYPDMRLVLDHCMKPEIGSTDPSAFERWANGMALLADKTNAYCKLSGLVTEVQGDWSLDVLKPYVNHVLNSFGAPRVMWGSDWPVCRLRAEYGDWFDAANKLVAHLDEPSQDDIFGATAVKAYRLDLNRLNG